MNAQLLLLTTWLLAVGPLGDDRAVISGVAVNGSAGRVPLAGAHVILQANQDGAFTPVAETTADSAGRFSFTDLPLDPSVVYLPGVSHHDVYHPGPRVRLSSSGSVMPVTLVAYDAIESPSPLVIRRHEIDVRPGTGFLEITETLVIDNPSLAAYVGEKSNDRPTVTLTLSLPDGFEKVTFDTEFHGRSFAVHKGTLITDLPWPPGKREIEFLYRLPVDQKHHVLIRLLDQPTDHVVLRVTAPDANRISCNLAAASRTRDGETVFEHQGSALPAGFQIELQLGDLPIRWEVYGRWLAVGTLVVLVVGSVVPARSRSALPQAEKQTDQSPARKSRIAA